MRIGDLDVVAVHRVVGHAQVRDLRPFLLAFFQLHQEAAGVGLQAPQLVEVRVIAVGNYAAVDDAGGRLGMNCFFQQGKRV